MTTPTLTNRIRRIRRLAESKDLALHRRRGTDPDAFYITDPYLGGLLVGGQFGISLDDAERWLTEPLDVTGIPFEADAPQLARMAEVLG